MIGFLKQNKVALGGALVLLLLLFGYFMFFSGDSSTPALTSSDSDSPLSSDLLVTLQNLHSITLNNAIFTDPVFVTLSDFGVSIPPDNVGRRNPFAPLDTLSIGGGTSSTSISLPAVH